MRIHYKEILLLGYVFYDYDLYINRLNVVGFSTSGIFYLALFSLVLLGLVSASQIKNNSVRILFAAILFLSAVFFDVYRQISAEFLTYPMFISLMHEIGSVADALAQYFSLILMSVASGLALFVGLALKPRLSLPYLKNGHFILIPVIIMILLTTTLFLRTGLGARGLPPGFTTLSYLNLSIYESLTNTLGQRQEIKITRVKQHNEHDIVLIMDESVLATYLDINEKKGILTNLNHSYDDVNIYNYGYAASISNCSSGTNMTVRYGGTRSDYLKINSTMPSIWKYAKNANFRTVFIDAQRINKELTNRMTQEELMDIDQFIQFDDVPKLQRDQVAANKLAELINDDSHDFIIVNKRGAHFPIHNAYPAEFTRYTPALPRDRFSMSRVELSKFGSEKDWEMYRNSYRNTLLWNVGNFFSIFFEKANLDKAVVLYTSDHGQNLGKKGSSGTQTHCNIDPVMEEGLVSLVIIEGSDLNTLDWSKELDANRDKSSHYNIFPTLLTLMSYEKNQVKSIYGNSLNIKTRDEFTFNARFNARLGMKPVWKKIVINKIKIPE